jgi:trehalose 6-phosphate synthase
LVERVLAIDRFLEENPQYRRRIVFVQLCAPSRVHLKRYRDLTAEIDELVEKKNWKYSEEGWEPILHLKRHFSPSEVQLFYALADVCIVSSLHDGMNLVAKEFVASRRNDDGVLVLSRFTGAARELADAVQMNPYSISEFAAAIKAAVEMPPQEQRKRMESMRRVVNEYNVYRWAGSILTDMFALKKA